MSSDQVNPVDIANGVAAEIANTAKSVLAEAVSSIVAAGAEQLENQRANARRIDARLEERTKEQSNAVDTAIGKLSAAEARLGSSVTSLVATLEDKIVRYEAVVESAREAAGQAAEVSAAAASALVEVEHRTAAAGAAEEAAQRRIAEAGKAEERAKRAVALVTLRADVMVDQAVAEREAKLRRKEVLAELDRNEAKLADRFDAQNEFIDRGMDEYYADVRERLEKGFDAEADEPTEDGEDAGGDVQQE